MPPASYTASQGSVSSTCSTPSGATRNATFISPFTSSFHLLLSPPPFPLCSPRSLFSPRPRPPSSRRRRAAPGPRCRTPSRLRCPPGPLSLKRPLHRDLGREPHIAVYCREVGFERGSAGLPYQQVEQIGGDGLPADALLGR